MAVIRVPDLAAQKAELATLLKEPLKKGETWYLVDCHWFKQWKKYVGFDSWDLLQSVDPNIYPGPIDNSGILDDAEQQTLKEHLIDELDFVLLPTIAWEKLVAWYGTVQGQQPIARKVIEQGMFVKNCKVEVYLTKLTLGNNSDQNKTVDMQFSKVDTIDTIEKKIRQLFNIPTKKETRLWNKCLSNAYELLDKPEKTVQDVGLCQDQVLMIEQKNEDGTWSWQSPSQSSSKSSFSIGGCTSSNSCDFSDSGRSTRSHQPGLRGLSNLGNTCFMNSALQCLSNTPPLTDYFLENKYVAELNYDNPLGMRGEIAKAYADLIKQIWQENNSPVTPRAFKMQVGRFAPQFSGFQQQDSQELLSFLLDGLHEDLNRIRNKPYVELRDDHGRPDEVVAEEAWTRHCRRNDSVIVDIFHGLFKSTLVCPICKTISVTFDPFCYLSLPLPSKSEQLLEALLVPLDQEVKPVLFKVSIPKPGVVEDLCKALSNISNIPSKNMVVTLIYNHRFDKIFSKNDDLSTADRDITVYEVPTDETGTLNAHVAVYLRAKERYGTGLFGRPFIMSLPRDDTSVHTLYTLLLRHMARYVKVPEHELYDDREAKGHVKRDSYKCNGEIDMDEGSQEGFKPCGLECNLVPSGKDSIEEERRSPEMRSKRRDHNTRSEDHKPFTIHLVNSLGTTELRRVLDYNRPIDFGNRSYIALEWEKEAKNIFYDDDAAEDIEKHPSVNSMHTRKKYVRLKDCIQLFTSKEQLGANDPWYCPTCKKHQQATKKFDLWSLPQILVVHLKRFSYNKYYRDKLDTLVDFSIRDLDMHEFLAGPQMNSCVYDLIAVSNHYGGLGGGHYTAYAKNQLSQNWYYYDDSSVSSASKDQIVSKAAYVLFYQRRGDDDDSARRTAPNTGHNVDIMDMD